MCSSDRVFCSVKMAEEVYTFTVLSVNTTEEEARKDVAMAETQIVSYLDASTEGICQSFIVSVHIFMCS